jgi:hypothetical protein
VNVVEEETKGTKYVKGNVVAKLLAVGRVNVVISPGIMTLATCLMIDTEPGLCVYLVGWRIASSHNRTSAGHNGGNCEYSHVPDTAKGLWMCLEQ